MTATRSKSIYFILENFSPISQPRSTDRYQPPNTYQVGPYALTLLYSKYEIPLIHNLVVSPAVTHRGLITLARARYMRSINIALSLSSFRKPDQHLSLRLPPYLGSCGGVGNLLTPNTIHGVDDDHRALFF